MQFSGMVVVKLPADDVVAALNNPEVLQTVLPHCVEARSIQPGQFVARITRKIGPFPVTAEPEITLTPLVDGKCTLTIAGGNVLAGRAETAMDLRLEPIPAGTRLLWDGTVSASGLAGRLLIDRKDRLAMIVRNVFLRFKHRVEPKPAKR